VEDNAKDAEVETGIEASKDSHSGLAWFWAEIGSLLGCPVRGWSRGEGEESSGEFQEVFMAGSRVSDSIEGLVKAGRDRAGRQWFASTQPVPREACQAREPGWDR